MIISGIGSIKNITTGKEFVFKSFDVEKQWEIYQNQLNLNIHHNKKLQNDWLEQGKDKFEFLIIEEIDDEFILLEEFEDYLLVSDNYNSVEITDFFFEYITGDTLSLLFQVMGKDSCAARFEEMLNEYDLPIDYYEEIKEEMMDLIDEDVVTDDNLMDKLNDILEEKSNENRIIVWDLQEKLFDDLHSFTGIGGLSSEFIDMLHENNLSEEIGYKIRENIEELIFLNSIADNDILKQIDECIEVYHEKLNDEIKEKLMLKADQLQTNEEFLNTLKNHDLTYQNVLNISDQLKDLISSNSVYEDNFDEKLEELVDSEIERVWLETKNELIKYLDDKIGHDEINPALKITLDSNHLDYNLAFEFKNKINQLIEDKQITNINEINVKLYELIDEAVAEVYKLKDDLLILLKEEYGETDLSYSFKHKLDEVKLSKDDGIEFIKILSNEVSSFMIKSPEALKNRADELIFNKNKDILLNQYYDFVGKDENSELFSTKLKNNHLSEKDGYIIRMSILDSINDEEELSKIIDFRNNLESKVDDILAERGEYRQNLLTGVTNDIYANLNDIIGDKEINESFKSKLYQNNLGLEYVELIKDEINQYIQKDDPQWDVELKYNHLCELKNNTEGFVSEIIQRESDIRNDEYNALKLDLSTQLNELIGVNENTGYFNMLLAENNLDENIAFAIRDEFKQIIEADDIYYSDKFNYKYEELLFIKSKSVKEILLNFVKTQKDIYYEKLASVRLDLLNELDSVMGKDSLDQSFKNRLYSHELSLDYAQTLRDEIEKFINSDDVENIQFNTKLNELTHLKNNGIDSKIEEILDREYEIRLGVIADLKKQLTEKLNNIVRSENYENALKSNNLSHNIGKKIKDEIHSLINSDNVFDSKFNYKYEELENIDVEMEMNKLLSKEINIYKNNLSKARKNVLEIVYSIIGRNKIHSDFKVKLHENYLHEDVFGDIKYGFETFINSDEVFDKQYEFKLDELSSFNHEKIQEMIDELIKKESEIKQKELNDIRTQLNGDLINLIGKDDNEYFTNLLKDNSLNTQTGVSIRSEMLNLINSDEVCDNQYEFKLDELAALKDEGIESRLNKLIDAEVKRYNSILKDLRVNLKVKLKGILNSAEFKNKLHDNQLEFSFKNKFERELLDLIDSDNVYDSNFENKLDELSSFNHEKIQEMIDELIKKESEIKQKELNDIRTQLNGDLINLIGEKDNKFFTNLLKDNSLNTQTGVSIRSEMLNLINSDEVLDNQYEFKLDELTALKEEGVESRLNKLIDAEVKRYNFILKDLRVNLKVKLKGILNSAEFKKKLHDNQLEYSFKNKFERELLDFIDSDNVYDSNFENKLDELLDLKQKTVDSKLNELITREAKIKSHILNDLRKELTDSLNDLIALDGTEFNDNLLKNNNLNSSTAKLIRNELEELLTSQEPVDDSYEFKLDELQALKEEGLKNRLNKIVEREEEIYRNTLNDIRGKLSSDIDSIIQNDEFKENLYEKQVDDSFIEVISNDLDDLINSDVPRNNKFEVKLDELDFINKTGIKIPINQLIKTEANIRQKECRELRKELSDKVYEIIGKDNSSILFRYKLLNYKINNETRDRIRKRIIDLVSSKKPVNDEFKYKLAELRHLKEYGIEKKIDDIIAEENEVYVKSLKEKRESLINSMNVFIGEDTINVSLKNKLQSFDLEENYAYEIKLQLYEFITSEDVSNNEFSGKLDELTDLENKGIESKIDELIQNEIDRRNAVIKEKLLKELHDITGSAELNETFSQKLDDALFDEEFGFEIINHFESEIDSLNIEEGFDFEKAIDEMIFDENKNILLNQTYEIIGKESNSTYYSNMLKSKMISQYSGNEIRDELISLINNADSGGLVEIKKRGMRDVFDEIISNEAARRQNQLMELREKLLRELNAYTNNESFKTQLKSKNLDDSYVNIIKNEVRDLIRLDEIAGDYEFKVDELIDIDRRGIEGEIKSAIDRHSKEVNGKYEKLKEKLLVDLKLISDNFNSFSNFYSSDFDLELSKRDLDRVYGKKAINELQYLIKTSKIKDSKFTTKYEELQDIENKTVEGKLIEFLDEYADKQKSLLDYLKSKMKSNSWKFLKYDLSKDFMDNVEKDMENKIKRDEISSTKEIDNAISTYIEGEAKQQELALDKLFSIVGSRRISFKFRAKLMLKGLSGDEGKLIAKKVEDKIRLEKLRANDVSDEIDRQMNIFSKKGLNSKPSGGSKSKPPKYVFCENCGHRNINGDNFCEQCGSRLSKLK